MSPIPCGRMHASGIEGVRWEGVKPTMVLASSLSSGRERRL